MAVVFSLLGVAIILGIVWYLNRHKLRRLSEKVLVLVLARRGDDREVPALITNPTSRPLPAPLPLPLPLPPCCARFCPHPLPPSPAPSLSRAR